jgi:hypothetical protein
MNTSIIIIIRLSDVPSLLFILSSSNTRKLEATLPHVQWQRKGSKHGSDLHCVRTFSIKPIWYVKGLFKVFVDLSGVVMMLWYQWRYDAMIL